MMDMAIRKVCVIGAGVMGAGIAAHVANAGVPVLLLDIAKDGPDRDAVAKGAVARMLKTDPAPFMSKGAAKLVETGNIDDHLDRIAECDWIVEAIVERLDIKQSLYARIEALKRPGTAVSSNTSTIPQDLHDHPFLQSAALYAADRDRARDRYRPGGGGQGRGFRRP